MSTTDSILWKYFEFQMEKSGQTGTALSDLTVACIKLHRARTVGELLSLYEQCHASNFPNWHIDALAFRLYQPQVSLKGFIRDLEWHVAGLVQGYHEDLGSEERGWTQRDGELADFYERNYLPYVWGDAIRMARGDSLSFFERVTAYTICAYFDSRLVQELTRVSVYHSSIFDGLERIDAVPGLKLAYEPLLRKYLTREMRFWNRNVALTLEKEVH